MNFSQENRNQQLDAILREVLGSASSEEERMKAFCRSLLDKLPLSAAGIVMGDSVSVRSVQYDGSPRRGLIAVCQKRDGSWHKVSLADLELTESGEGALYLAAYQRWLELGDNTEGASTSRQTPRKPKAGLEELDLNEPMELVLVSVKEGSARCRILGTDRELTLRAREVWDRVPGEIATVVGNRRWQYAKHPYLSGKIVDARIDVRALGLTPLPLEEQWLWDPEDEYWGEEGEETPAWVQTVFDRGPRPCFEMGQVLPGAERDIECCPIVEAADMKECGDEVAAERLLMSLLEQDMRCLDAHAHLGNLDFDLRPDQALRHYEVGVRIAELSFPASFDGLLLWSCINNRPFLRCLHGYGLALWRLGKVETAAQIFKRMLWLNPVDNQGARFLVEEARLGTAFEEACC